MQWYYMVNGQQIGPVEQDALEALIRDGTVKPDDLVWNAGMGNQWAKVESVFEIDEVPVPTKPPAPQQMNTHPAQSRRTVRVPAKPSGPQQMYAPAVAIQVKSSAAAVWSLVLGILSFFCLGPLTGIPAIICGHVARSNIRGSSGTLTGSGMALTGLIMGYVATIVFVVVFVFGILGAIAVPSFMKARATSQKNACINNLRQIEAAKEQWALENKKSTGDEVVIEAVNRYLITVPVCPAGGSYKYNVIGTDCECSIPNHRL